MRMSLRSLATLLLFLGVASTAQATPVSYAIDVEITIDNGIGLPAGSYLGAGIVTADVPDPAPGGLAGATLLSLTVTLGADSWTLADSPSDPYALALVDGTPIGLLFSGVNANGHLLTLAFDPSADLAIADLIEPEANHFAIGSYTLSAIPEPGVALLLGLGVLGLAAARRR